MITWTRNEKILKGTKETGETVDYEVAMGYHPVNEQQYNLPIGCTIKYNNGSMIIHIDGYYLLRHWFYKGNYWDRIAIPENNIYLKMN